MIANSDKAWVGTKHDRYLVDELEQRLDLVDRWVDVVGHLCGELGIGLTLLLILFGELGALVGGIAVV